MNETIQKPALWKRLLITFLLFLITTTIFYSCSAIYRINNYHPVDGELIGTLFENNSQDTVLVLDADDMATFVCIDESKNGLYVYNIDGNTIFLTNGSKQQLVFIMLSENEMFYQNSNDILYKIELEDYE